MRNVIYRYNFIYLLIALVFDLILGHLFPIDGGFQSFSFVPMLSLSFLCLSLRDMHLQSALYLGVMLGVLRDFFSNGGLGIYLISMIAVIVFATYWHRRIAHSLLETVLLGMMSLCLVLLCGYGLASLQGLIHISLPQYFAKVGFFTILGNTALIWIAFMMKNSVVKHTRMHERKLKKSESSLQYRR